MARSTCHTKHRRSQKRLSKLDRMVNDTKVRQTPLHNKVVMFASPAGLFATEYGKSVFSPDEFGAAIAFAAV